MGRKKGEVAAAVPKLFQRGKNGHYYFRKFLNGKDTWINTNTADPEKAKEVARDIVSAKMSVEALSRVEASAKKLADTFVESITGKKEFTIPIKDAYEKWVETMPHYDSHTEHTRKFQKTIMQMFSSWCGKEGLEYLEQIDGAAALKYAKRLWETGVTGVTYNTHISFLSRVFNGIDAITPLPNRNPFDSKRVPRKKKADSEVEGHQALEPDQLKSVIAEAAKTDADYRDLFVLGAQTGMKLKDAALLQWKSIDKGFIEITPHKTSRTGNTARIPISPVLDKLFLERSRTNPKSEYVLPGIAEHYLKNHHFVTKKCKSIFEDALGKENTQAKAGPHRKRNTSIYSFHSFRTTFMSLLAMEDVSTRDAMSIMGWESPEMIRVYEKILEKARGDSDKRAMDLINRIDGLKFKIPDVKEKEKVLRPDNKKALKSLVEKYSNVTIGKIYGISDVAVKKWMDKFGIRRTKRIESAEVSDEEIARTRGELRA